MPQALNDGAAIRACLLALAAAIVFAIRVLPLSLAGVPGDRDRLTWRADDGREHVYLGDYDSYLWAREARNYLRTGTTCDAVVAGECRDTFTNAPVGAEMRYARSLHVAAIVGLHRTIRLLAPDHPLTASVFWVPVVVGVLGVLPAFAIGARLAGATGGFAAAVAIGGNPLFIRRSAGGDNDVWNVVLPLYVAWAAVAALAAVSRARAAVLAALAGALVALHAATWSGWIFTHVVVLAGLGVTAGIEAVGAGCGGEQRARLVRALGVLAIYWLVAGAATAMAGAGAEALLRPFEVAQRFFPTTSTAPAVIAPEPPWPDVLRTVGELVRPDLQEIARALVGPLQLFVAWLGMILLLLPERDWRTGHLGVLVVGALLYRALVVLPDPARTTLLVLLAVPLAGALLVRALRSDAEAPLRPGGFVVAVWFLAALFQAFEGLRLVMLLVPAFGLPFGVAIGRFHAWLAGVVRPHAGRHARFVPALALVVVAIVLVPTVLAGVAAGRGYRPVMHDAWWDTLVGLRETSPPDAIVSTWWDYGHWVKYVAERRVNADGSTLATHVPHWLGRALLAPTENETAGLLRMLNCGSDATPAPEGRLGAWGRLVAHGVDSVQAYATVLAVAGLERDAARAHLIARGLAPAAADDVLEATHCTPPPNYLVVSSAMVAGSGWSSIGWWDARRAWLAAAVGRRPETEILDGLTTRFGMTAGEARALYARAARLETPRDVDEFVAPRLTYVLPWWAMCTAPSDGPWTCRIGMPVENAGIVLEAVEYRPDVPGETRLRTSAGHRVPAALLIARGERLEEVAVHGGSGEKLGVLVDEPGRRVLVGSPDLLRSTFTRLVFLDGRLASRFEPVDDRTGYANERVRTWRVR